MLFRYIKFFLLTVIIWPSLAQSSEEYITTNSSIFELDVISRVNYIAYKRPKKLTLLPENHFDQSQLSSKYKLLTAAVQCNTNEWLNKLSEEQESDRITAEAVNYASTDAFIKNFKLEVAAELSFVYKKRRHVAILAYHHSKIGRDNYITFLLVEDNEVWRLSSNDNLKKIAHFLYLKPEVIHDIISKRYIEPELKKYIWESVLYVNQNFFWSYLASESKNESYLGLTIPLYKRFQLTGNKDLVANTNTSFMFLNRTVIQAFLYNYNQEVMEAQSVTRSTNLSRGDMKFDSIPELALASIIFNKSWDVVSRHCIGYDDNLKLQYMRHRAAYNELRIEWRYKVRFTTVDGEYVFISFAEWEMKKHEGTMTKDYYIADKSCLLKKDKEEWVLVHDKFNPLSDLQRLFDKLSYEGVKHILLSAKGEYEDINNYLALAGIPQGPHNYIFTNTLLLNDTEFTGTYAMPDRMKRDYRIMDVFDSKSDGQNEYWMDR